MADSEPEIAEDSTWIVELETALLEDCDFGTLRNICNGRTFPDDCRADAWQVCLNVQGKVDSLSSFDELFDMKEQAQLRADCSSLVDKLGNEEEDKVSIVSDLESIVTFYCKSRNVTYTSNNGWLDILQVLLSLKLPKSDTYNCFYNIVHKYIPRDCTRTSKAFHLFRLLLQYHDPQLCSYLDTMKVIPHKYTQQWFSSLLASSCDLQVIHNMWDVYLQHADPFLVFFLTLVILINAKDHIMSSGCDSTDKIIEFISSVPGELEAGDIEDFCSLAQYYASKTPQSFRRDFQGPLFGASNQEPNPGPMIPVSEALCLPVSVSELLQANQLGAGDGVRYFVVDCRPADQYNSGHLPTAFHLDANLMLQNPEEFNTAVDALFATQRQAIANGKVPCLTNTGAVAGGEHLCFIGSGREQEDQYVFMVVANFLQKHQGYVSITRGGFAALHQELKHNLLEGLTDHCPTTCVVCESERGASLSDSSVNSDKREDSLFGKLSEAMKSKSAEVKETVEKITNYIKIDSPQKERHVERDIKGHRVYRNTANVFSIDDGSDEDQGGISSDEERRETVNISTWLQKPDVIYSCQCQHIDGESLVYPSYIMVTETHLFVLRELYKQKGNAHIICRRSLRSIVKITSKKSYPEKITLKYGTNDDAGMRITNQDRFIIAKAGEATKAIKYQVIKVLEKLDSGT